LKGYTPAPVAPNDWLASRRTLGGAFGTKKAQAALRAAERNQIDVAAMEGVMGHLQDRVDANTEALPSQGWYLASSLGWYQHTYQVLTSSFHSAEAKASADAARPIPAFDASATTPAGAYPLANIVPAPEWASLGPLTAALSHASSTDERTKMLPDVRSAWITQKLEGVFGTLGVAAKTGTDMSKKDTLKAIAYVSTLMAFRKLYRTLDSADKIASRLRGVPSTVREGVLGRFSETARGSANAAAIKTSAMETKLLTHMFAMCLHVDNFAVDSAVLAKDLNMTQKRYSYTIHLQSSMLALISFHSISLAWLVYYGEVADL
jgi:DNA-directed RNA polymerase I subunit RPA49